MSATKTPRVRGTWLIRRTGVLGFPCDLGQRPGAVVQERRKVRVVEARHAGHTQDSTRDLLGPRLDRRSAGALIGLVRPVFALVVFAPAPRFASRRASGLVCP